MRLLLGKEMGKLDAAAVTDYDIPSLILMENAGMALTNATLDMFKDKDKFQKQAAIFCGSGNNGGDGLVVARHLHNRGWQVRLFLMQDETKFQGDALVNWNICLNLKIKYNIIKSIREVNLLKMALGQADIIIDAIYGTGFYPPLPDLAQKVIEIINDSSIPVIAVDLPSGMVADTGQAEDAIIANKTVTMAYAKLGLIAPKAKSFVGDLIVADIGLPFELLNLLDYRREYIGKKFCKKWLHKRDSDSHKGNFGHVLVVGGQKGMIGAPILASRAAFRSGAGLVTTAIPKSSQKEMPIALSEAMSIGLKESGNGALDESAVKSILNNLNKKILVLGMGIGRKKETENFIKNLLIDTNVPMVLDADALFHMKNIYNKNKNIFKWQKSVIMTPHPGEMARLMDININEVQNNRVDTALNAAKKWQAIMVLKGEKTVVATPEGRVFINSSGNAGMATAGSGDVLSGIIGAFLAQGLSPVIAAIVGVYLHGYAGDIAKDKLGENSLMAGDIIKSLPQAINDVKA